MNQSGDKSLFKLKIDLVPSTVWNDSVHQILKNKNKLNKWKAIKKEIFEKEGKKCFICKQKSHRYEAHEFWDYNDENHIQTLISIHHLCAMCHRVKHIGFWAYSNEGIRILHSIGLTKDDLITHFCKVNECSVQDFIMHEEKSFRTWNERNKFEWKQDFGKYSKYLK